MFLSVPKNDRASDLNPSKTNFHGNFPHIIIPLIAKVQMKTFFAAQRKN